MQLVEFGVGRARGTSPRSGSRSGFGRYLTGVSVN
jgi:hypothetical protein